MLNRYMNCIAFQTVIGNLLGFLIHIFYTIDPTVFTLLSRRLSFLIFKNGHFPVSGRLLRSINTPFSAQIEIEYFQDICGEQIPHGRIRERQVTHCRTCRLLRAGRQRWRHRVVRPLSVQWPRAPKRATRTTACALAWHSSPARNSPSAIFKKDEGGPAECGPTSRPTRQPHDA